LQFFTADEEVLIFIWNDWIVFCCFFIFSYSF